jgi:hypothetical protein
LFIMMMMMMSESDDEEKRDQPLVSSTERDLATLVGSLRSQLDVAVSLDAGAYQHLLKSAKASKQFWKELGALSVEVCKHAATLSDAFLTSGQWVSHSIMSQVIVYELHGRQGGLGCDGLKLVMGALVHYGYLPMDVVVRASIHDLVIVVEQDRFGCDDCLAVLNTIISFALPDENVMVIIEELFCRACSLTAISSPLRKFLIRVGNNGDTSVCKSFNRAFKQICDRGGSSQVCSAIVLTTSVLGARFPNVLLKTLSRVACLNPSDDGKCTASF